MQKKEFDTPLNRTTLIDMKKTPRKGEGVGVVEGENRFQNAEFSFFKMENEILASITTKQNDDNNKNNNNQKIKIK